MNDYDKSIHSNPDAQAWAKFFIDTLAEQSWRIEDIDESLMTGWFANAMMAMHDHVKREWVGLTDDEIKDIREDLTYDDEDFNELEFARDIEAKLRKKNTVELTDKELERELPAEAFGELSPVWKKRF